jgi:hypothetical protein
METMKRKTMTVVLAAVALLAVTGWMLLPVQNPYQIAGTLHDTVAHKPAMYTNAPDTSSSFSMAGYIGAAWFVSTGDTAATGDVGGYFLYQDSGATATWTVRDSIELAGEEGSYKLHYVPRQAGAWVRSIYRGTPAAADTFYVTGVLLRSCQTSPC